MQTITIDDRTFSFKEINDGYFEGSSPYYTYVKGDDYTIFYEGEAPRVERYGFFGRKKRIVYVPIEVFRIKGHITDPNLSKYQVKAMIEEGLRVLSRKEEIARGEII